MRILLIILTLSIPVHLFGQTDDAVKIVDHFFKWDIQNGHGKLNPRFEESSNGMTQLNFVQCDSLLTKYRFSNSFIKRSKERYSACSNNLAQVQYGDLMKFEDIDQFEEINCDFQSDPWFYDSMEPYSFYRIKEARKISDYELEIFVSLAHDAQYKMGSELIMSIMRIDKEWRIVKSSSL